jgi:hypothetical protein
VAQVEKNFSEFGNTGGVYPFTKIHSRGERPHEVRLLPPASSLAAALLGSHFEHPAQCSPLVEVREPVRSGDYRLAWGGMDAIISAARSLAISFKMGL